MDFSVQLMTCVQVTIIWLIVKLSMLMVGVIIAGRMIEIYVQMAIAPIPIATFPNSEMSNIGKNFLKSFAAVCIQGVLIYIVVNMFGLLFGEMGDIGGATNFTDSLLAAAGYSFVLVIAIYSTGRWAKSICNAS
jgi:uncharacterized membrane protein YczE